MPERHSGLFKFLCSTCRDKSPMFVSNQYRWRCDHHKLTVFESDGRRSLVYDQESVRSDKRPIIDNRGHGPFFTRFIRG